MPVDSRLRCSVKFTQISWAISANFNSEACLTESSALAEIKRHMNGKLSLSWCLIFLRGCNRTQTVDSCPATCTHQSSGNVRGGFKGRPQYLENYQRRHNVVITQICLSNQANF